MFSLQENESQQTELLTSTFKASFRRMKVQSEKKEFDQKRTWFWKKLQDQNSQINKDFHDLLIWQSHRSLMNKH